MQKNNIKKIDKYYTMLNAAGAVFARLGFHKSTISLIAAEAGVADGTIYLYFKNKDDILYQFLNYKTTTVFDKMRRASSGADDAEIKLRNLIRCHLKAFQDDKNMAVIFHSEVRYLRDIEFQIKDISKMYLDFLTEIIERGQVQGTIKRNLFMGLAKHFILGAVDGVITTWIAAEGKYDLVSMADPLVDLYMNGIKNN
ncbi:MAG: TetR/AcrR family transcriptional regulator [Thermodesulfobacteriota bacterium]|nr:TetR/AcrR family transcriptional regulator [Thermodesulfobacteriota bacterium]